MEPMMKGITRHHQIRTQNSSLTSPTTITDTGTDIIAPHYTSVHPPTAFSDVFARFECKLNVFQSASQTPKARAAALTMADQDVDAAKRLVLSMLTRRNTLAPISILPAEILARIFYFYMSFSNQFLSPILTFDFINVTHVCQHWRQVALNDSTLWTHFLTYSRNKDWIAERLSRARNAPLVIALGRSMGKDTFSLFIPHISHTREIYIPNLSFVHLEFFQEINIRTAPILERLELSVSNMSPMGIKHLLARSFFKGPLPKLRIFCVCQIVFPWSLVPPGQLTQLKVVLDEEILTSDPEVSPHDNLNQLIDLLVNCPSLETLALENCLPAMLSEFSGGQTISLPRLSCLSLRGSHSRVTNLLKMLKLSSSTTLCLDCSSENTATHSDHDILPLLSAHFNDPIPVKFRSFKIRLNHLGHTLNVVASTSLPTLLIPRARVIQADTDTDVELSLSLSFPHLNGFSDVADMLLRRACDVLPLSKLEFFSIFSPVRTVNWGELFRHCTEVTTVQVSGHGTTSLLQALTPPQHSRGKGSKRRRGNKGKATRRQASNSNNNKSLSAPVEVPVFPKLTSLLLEVVDFTEVLPGSGVLFDLVLSAVQERKAKKTPLTTLCIDNCVISSEQAVAFEKVVRDFRWDHYEGDDEDEDEYDDDDGYDHGCDCGYDYNGFDYDDD